MNNSVDNISDKSGLAPGVFVTVGVNETLPSKLFIYKLGAEGVAVAELDKLEINSLERTKNETLWIDVQGFSNLQLLHELFDLLKVPLLLQEDIINTKHRPKIEAYGDTILIITKRIIAGHRKRLFSEHIVFLVGSDYIVTLQPPVLDSFQGARTRLTTSHTPIYDKNYIFYMLLDNLTDSYFTVLEHIHSRIDKLENTLLNNKKESPPQEELASLKHDISLTRRIIVPMRKFIGDLRYNRERRFQNALFPYLSDLNDHIEQLAEACDIYQESIMLLLQINSENINLRTNEIMKTLTLISTIFLPLTFIAGIYGMNFSYMPELQSEWGYPLCLTFMALISLVLYFNFKNRKWL